MYSFRYERLLEVKEKILEHKQRQLDLALSALEDVRVQLEEVGREMLRTHNHIAERPLTGKELSVLVGYIALLDAQKAALNDEKTRRESRVSTLRSELYGLEVELKMFEKLKSKTLQTIKKARNQKEQKLMDEIGLRGESL
jgi:flagellar FliJ protein